MAKIKKAFFCQSCGYESAKWMGKCPSCHQWNTFTEEIIQAKDNKTVVSNSKRTVKKPIPITAFQSDSTNYFATPDHELNRVLGGGIVSGAVILVGGEPGIGKSTLLLQLALQLKGIRSLYLCGEESAHQVKLRADRLGELHDNCYLLPETQTQNIFKQAEELEPDLLIVDSIQTLISAHIDSGAGSISQLKECTAELIRYAKETDTPIFLIGHITKEGSIAGPKILEHMVDTVLQFEGNTHLSYRMLRALKNRFGSTSELGIYEMQSTGMRPVENPSELLLSQRDQETSGVTIAAGLEGTRPLLLEVQSLVSPATYGTPQRTPNGISLKRLQLLLAVLEKRCNYPLSSFDVFLNLAGGINMEDPALDLAICLSIVSSFRDIAIEEKSCFIGEVGLGGEIRAVPRLNYRIKEAKRLGFKKVFISEFDRFDEKEMSGSIVIKRFSRLEDLVHYLVQ